MSNRSRVTAIPQRRKHLANAAEKIDYLCRSAGEQHEDPEPGRGVIRVHEARAGPNREAR